MSALWTAAEAAAATGAADNPSAFWRADGVSIDSRNVAPRDLFVALAGPRHDGHEYVAQALRDGAAAAMVHRPLPSIDPRFLLAVPDTQAGLEALARAARARSKGRILAVTGSVGKTGTKEALAKLLSLQGPTHASAGNLNNQIGTPLSLARMPASSSYGIFELGMNHAGEIAPLSRLVRPHAAIITTVEAVHLEFFPNVEAIADAKAEIFLGMDGNGTAILPRDNAHYARMATQASHLGRIWSFGAHEAANARLISATLTANGSRAEAMILGRRIAFALKLPGPHQISNALAALLGVAAVDGDLVAAAAALADLTPVKGRGTATNIAVGDGSVRIIDETYNASPAATRAALLVLGMMSPDKSGRRIAVLGDMLELGAAGPAEHAGLAEAAIAADVAQVFTAGPLSRHLHEALPAARRGGHAADAASLAPMVAAALRAGDIVLIKGSAGSRMSGVVTALQSLGQQTEARHAV